MDKLPLESKKWTMGALGIAGVLIASAAAVAVGVPALAVFPWCIKGIIGCAGTFMAAQGTQDSISASKAACNASTTSDSAKVGTVSSSPMATDSALPKSN